MARQNPGHSLPNADKKPHRLFRVVIIDNDTNTYDEVIAICMQALSIGFDAAFQIALAVDNNGKAEVFHGDEASAFQVAEVIRTIGIEVRVEPLDAA